MSDIQKEWDLYVKKHGYIKNYAHFDKRVSLEKASIRSYVEDSKKVARHSFYPFVFFEQQRFSFKTKSQKTPRKLFYSSHLDRCVYQRYAFLLNYNYNQFVKDIDIDDVAIAYRDNKRKDNIDFAKDAFDFIKKCEKAYIFVGDFTSFFDRLDHLYLKEMICKLLHKNCNYNQNLRLRDDYYAVFKNITNFASFNYKNLYEILKINPKERGARKKLNQRGKNGLNKKEFELAKKHIEKNINGYGIPQGSPISAVLSNIYMMDFDKKLKEYVKEQDGLYMRYSDDFIVILPLRNCDNDDIQNMDKSLFKFIKSLLVYNSNQLAELKEEKTKKYIFEKNSITSFDDRKKISLNYLGFLFEGMNISLRPSSINKYYYKMRRKAKTIKKMHSHERYAKYKRFFAKKLYDTYSFKGYSENRTNSTFINYLKRAHRKINLTDRASCILMKHYKEKIAKAIKR